MGATLGTMRLGFGVLLLVGAVAFPAQAAPRTYSLFVDGLACPFCAYGIEKQLSRIPGVATVDVHIRDGRVTVTMAEGAELVETAAAKAVADAGFTLRRFEPAGIR